MSNTVSGPDGLPRCGWCGTVDSFFPYHDHEWGYPVRDDIRLFEKLCLESFQSGLSWRTILDKRENFRAAFDGFDFRKVATYDENDVARLLADAGIVRHRGKIEAAINNAQRACVLIEETGSLAAYVWRFEPCVADLAPPQSQTVNAASIAMSKDMKKRGWKFVGPTTVFAFMQAMGMVNDHLHECVIRKDAEKARAVFQKPV